MVSIGTLRRNIQKDSEKKKYILYHNKISRQDFYVEAKDDRELEVEMRFLRLKPFCTRVRICTTKPIRAQKSH